VAVEEILVVLLLLALEVQVVVDEEVLVLVHLL
jgi:hypothetical protein